MYSWLPVWLVWIVPTKFIWINFEQWYFPLQSNWAFHAKRILDTVAEQVVVWIISNFGRMFFFENIA